MYKHNGNSKYVFPTSSCLLTKKKNSELAHRNSIPPCPNISYSCEEFFTWNVSSGYLNSKAPYNTSQYIQYDRMVFLATFGIT